MNIQEAKEDLKNTVLTYIRRDEEGNLRIPQTKQRPVVLIGPPGIGKTAIMEQVAEECSVGLVSYTITHHTRQSAIGLPIIREKQYGGKTVSVTEYTMSEIIASVYDCMEETGKKEGILFIDEINCVSETLAPAMLAFLQNKQFGSHKVPEGWVIAAAGNPAGFNKSVRDFDLVTLDRVRMLYVEENLQTFLNYAHRIGVHEAILSFLDIKPQDFYRVEPWEEGTWFATARGWEDLSRMLYAYEELNIEVTENFIGEFLQFPMIAGDFYEYYYFYKKFHDSCPLPAILEGRCPSEYETAMKNANHEERITLVHLMSGMLAEITKEGAGRKAEDAIVPRDAGGSEAASVLQGSGGTEAVNVLQGSGGTEAVNALQDSGESASASQKQSEVTSCTLPELWTNAVLFLQKNFGCGMELSAFLKELEHVPVCAEYLRTAKLPAFNNVMEILQTMQTEKEFAEKTQDLYSRLRQ